MVDSNLVDPADHPDLPHIAPNHITSRTGALLPYGTVRDDGVMSGKHLFAPGHILYSKIRPYLAKVARVDFAGLCSADMYPVSTHLNARYLHQWLLAPEFTAFAAGQQGRSVLPKINREGLAKLPVPVPPLGEQQRIVAAVEEHLSRLDAAEQLLAAADERVALLARSSMRSAFGSLDCAWTTLGEVADIKGGLTKDSGRQGDPAFVEAPYLRVANVQRGYLDLGEITTIRVHPTRADALRLEPGDVLFNEGRRPRQARPWLGLGGSDRAMYPPEPCVPGAA